MNLRVNRCGEQEDLFGNKLSDSDKKIILCILPSSNNVICMTIFDLINTWNNSKTACRLLNKDGTSKVLDEYKTFRLPFIPVWLNDTIIIQIKNGMRYFYIYPVVEAIIGSINPHKNPLTKIGTFDIVHSAYPMSKKTFEENNIEKIRELFTFLPPLITYNEFVENYRTIKRIEEDKEDETTELSQEEKQIIEQTSRRISEQRELQRLNALRSDIQVVQHPNVGWEQAPEEVAARNDENEDEEEPLWADADINIEIDYPMADLAQNFERIRREDESI